MMYNPDEIAHLFKEHPKLYCNYDMLRHFKGFDLLTKYVLFKLDPLLIWA